MSKLEKAIKILGEESGITKYGRKSDGANFPTGHDLTYAAEVLYWSVDEDFNEDDVVAKMREHEQRVFDALCESNVSDDDPQAVYDYLKKVA